MKKNICFYQKIDKKLSVQNTADICTKDIFNSFKDAYFFFLT